MHDPSQDFREVFFALCKGVDTSFSLAAYLSWENKCFTSLKAPRPENYCSAYRFGLDYMVYSWASKARVNLEGRDLKSVALESFKADEVFNKLTETRIKSWNARGASPRVEQLIHAVRRKVQTILGPLNLQRVLSGCRFGNGATATLSRRRARRDLKLTTLPLSVSPSALGLGKAFVESSPFWLSALLQQEVEGPCSLLPCCFEVIDYNVFDTVPKSLKTDRTIAKEPTLNGFLQQGVHVYLRERLRRFGVDLRDQTINQHWAGLAEELGLATLDAESASNSVTTALLEILLPSDWFWLLDILRSRFTRLPDGTLHKNCMFSSMGNAFTFELESLIFYSILTSTCSSGQIVSVYGDDMIVPQCMSNECIENLETFGFRINRSKTYTSGRFFESCGSHFWGSMNVTPVYQKKNPLESRFERIAAHNRLIRWALRMGNGYCLDPVVKSACSLLIRGHEDFSGPIGSESDNYFQVPYGGYRVYAGSARVKAWRLVTKARRSRQAGSYAYWLLLRASGRPSNDGRTVEAVNNFPRDPLVLSEFSEEKCYYPRKEKVRIESTVVDADWAR